MKCALIQSATWGAKATSQEALSRKREESMEKNGSTHISTVRAARSTAKGALQGEGREQCSPPSPARGGQGERNLRV